MLRFAVRVVIASSVALTAAASADGPTSRPAVANTRITIGRDTTRATGPLRADGTVDYVAAFNRRMAEGATPANNAAVVLLRVMGARSFCKDPARVPRTGLQRRRPGDPRRPADAAAADRR